VAEICARLDGLPLAIELAAARIKLLPPQAMLERLQESSLGLLTTGAHDLPVRQQTLRSAIQWSYDLLNADERRTFRWLSVFVGGCTLKAALTTIEPPPSLDLLDSLVNKSLLRQTETDDVPRLSMLETIREFGWEQLSHTHELEAARSAHAGYYLSFAEEAETNLAGVDQKTWLKRLNLEQDNLRATLHWAIEHHAGELAQRIAGALQPFWLTRGYWSEGRRWLEEALAMDSGATLAPAVRAKTLYGAGTLARFQGDFARARILCEASLTLYRALADNNGVLMALVELSRISDFQGDQTSTESFLAETASLLETMPDTAAKAYAYSEMATVIVSPGTIQYPSQAARYLAESVRINRALDNPAGLALALARQGSMGLFGDDSTLMQSRLDEAERLALELGDERILSRLAGIRALSDVQAGDFAAARVRFDNTLRQAVNRGDHQAPTWLPMLAAVLHRQGLDMWSARVFGMAESFSGTVQARAYMAALEEHFHVGEIRAEVRAQLGDEAFAREIVAGKRLTLDDLRTIPHPPETAPAQRASSSASSESLTARELEVLRLLTQDLSNPQIAERLVVSRRTVDAHLRAIYDKLDVKSRDAAVRAAREQGLI
jgi:DNA-binding CsgD family transcriptional regulator